MTAADFDTVYAKLRRANEHAQRFDDLAEGFFTGKDTYELILGFDRQAQEIDVHGRFYQPPPLAYLGAVYGDFLNCYRSALDHIVWALSIRHQPAPPPPHPLPHGNQWRYIGWPVALTQNQWDGAVGGRHSRLLIPALHDRFRSLQPFVTGPTSPEHEPLAMLDALWNIDKHRVIHIAEVDLTLEGLTAQRRA